MPEIEDALDDGPSLEGEDGRSIGEYGLSEDGKSEHRRAVGREGE
jgi:hypothetical protein